MKSTKSLRSLYPFYGNDNVPSAVANAVSDLVIWTDPDTVSPPLKVTASLINGLVCINFTDEYNQYIIKAYEGSSDLFTGSGVLSGYIMWDSSGVDSSGVDILRASLLANDPQPVADLYVHPSACLPRPVPYLSTVSIDGYLIDDVYIEVTVDDSITITQESSSSGEGAEDIYVNLYRNYSSEDPPIHTITIGTEPDNFISVSGDFHVWLKSDAECDIRVITADGIILTEVSNDSL